MHDRVAALRVRCGLVKVIEQFVLERFAMLKKPGGGVQTVVRHLVIVNRRKHPSHLIRALGVGQPSSQASEKGQRN